MPASVSMDSFLTVTKTVVVRWNDVGKICSALTFSVFQHALMMTYD